MIGDNGENRLFNYRPLFEFALGMMAGILLCSDIAPSVALIVAVILILIGCALMYFKKHRLAVLALAVLFGLGFAAVALPAEFAVGDGHISGIVCEVNENGGDRVVILERVILNGIGFNKRAKLSVNPKGSSTELKIGDRIEADAYIRLPNRRFSTYDERKSMLSKGVGCIAQANSLEVTGEHLLPAAELIHGIRASVENRIRDAFGDDSGMFTALLIGVRNELTDERAEAYRTSGTAHLLAISGFHIGIIVGAISLLIPKSRRIPKLLIILVFAAIYCTVAAYTPGIVRAAIMTVCLIAANAVERRPDMLSSLSLAAILILLFNPFQLYSLGLQFSFSAVFGIALFSSSVSRRLTAMHLPSALASAVSVCLSATAGTAVFQLRYYSSFTPYSLIANLFAVPAFSTIVILGAITVITAFIIPPAAPIIAILPRSILFAVEKLLSLVSRLPLASVEFSPPSAAACLIFLVLLFFMSEYVLRPKRKRLEMALPLLILFTFSYFVGIINA
ncbi:MAG: ComEC/Rec2 family competence protein [Clostridia bacterium]|nr:ComEC/Rec2 family competence protein [Clostridia bacterium]